ncbi:vascular endothelial growth factor A, long form isoform X5 [Dendropsophus ebraccatus]|uniref:vascular endothelial growth factor A, long form isoform X5 n=1 Tax=Dendropsophus ebraccatus TaxID=150705 RepID=UPI0038311C70
MVLGTMYFLFSWIYWGLLVYISSVQFSWAAPTYEREHREHKLTEVVSFINVYERSMCQVRETLVDIYQEYPDEVEFIFKPSCVALMRCAGCCSDENFECVPTEWYNVTMQILRMRPHMSQLYVEKSFQQHSRCECRQKKEMKGKQENHCEPCTDTERRKHLFVQDPQTCKCSCKNTDSRCKTKQLELNERTCRRGKKPRAAQPYAAPLSC